MTNPAVIVRIAILMLVCMHSSLAQFEDLKIDKVSAGHQFTEGPVWSTEGNYLLFSDVPSNKILRLVPGKGTSVYRESANGASGNGIDPHGALWTCETRTRRLVREGKNGVEVVLDKWDAKPLNAPNDIVIRKDGHAWFTDPAFGAQSDKKALDFYGVYHVPPKGAPELVMRWKTRPNGLALAPNAPDAIAVRQPDLVIALGPAGRLARGDLRGPRVSQQDVNERALLATGSEAALLDLEAQGLEPQFRIAGEREQLRDGRQIRRQCHEFGATAGAGRNRGPRRAIPGSEGHRREV